MKKALILTSVASMVDQFLLSDIQLLQELKYEIYVGCNFEKGNTCSIQKICELKDSLSKIGVKIYQIDFMRNVFDVKGNVLAYRQVFEMLSQDDFELIHCHSPIGGLIGRIAVKHRRCKRCCVIYTAHGFHFYKGAPLKNWLLFFPVEWLCSFLTDVLITINQEDYARAKRCMKAKQIEYVPGVGIDMKEFSGQIHNRAEKRAELGIPGDAKVLLSVGELNENKNHQLAIRAIAKIGCCNLHYVIAGRGGQETALKEMTDELGLSGRVHFLGFRNDIRELLAASDCFVFPSFREGLSVSLMEAMASGLPCAVSRIRGNTDLIDEDSVLFAPDDVDRCAETIIYGIGTNGQKIGVENREKVRFFAKENVISRMREIYSGKK